MTFSDGIEMRYRIRKADLDIDGPAIIDFWQHNFPSWPVEKFRWLYLGNVHGTADCWLVEETASGSVVGSTAVFPRRFRLDGRLIRGGVTGDFGIDRRHRILGPALMLQRSAAQACHDGKYDLLYGFPNHRSAPVTIRAGFSAMGPSHRFARVFRTEEYLKRALRIPMMPQMVAFAANGALRLLARETRFKLGPVYRHDLLRSPDERFDELWAIAQQNYRIIGERDREFLAWRFTDCPSIDYRLFTVYRTEDQKLAGYIVYHQEGRISHIADALARDPRLMEKFVLPAFLNFIVMSDCDSVSISVSGTLILQETLKRFRFLQRGVPQIFVALNRADDHLEEALRTPANWYLLASDSDGP